MKKLIIKKVFAVIFSAIIISSFFCTFFAGAAYNSQEFLKDLSSYAYYMISLDNNEVMFNKNENKKVAPAGFVKVLAAIAAIESWGNLDDVVTVTEKNLSLIKYTYGIRTAGLTAGQKYTKKQLIDCLIIYGANDVESVIAYEISGSAEAFVDKLNTLAKSIGCKNTKIVDMLGFDADGQYTTAKDVALIIQHAMKNSTFSKAFSQNQLTFAPQSGGESKTLNGSNRMMDRTFTSYFHKSVTGGKQTSTEDAGECMAAISAKDGYSYLTVVMKGTLMDRGPNVAKQNTSMTDARTLISWVYSNIRFQVIAAKGDIVHAVAIKSAKDTDKLSLTPEKDVSALVPSNVSNGSVLIVPVESSIPKNLTAPVNAGDVICKADVFYAEEKIATVNLVAANDVKLSVFGYVMNTLSNVLKSKIFIAFELILLIVLLAMFAMKLYNIGQKDKPKSAAKTNTPADKKPR